MEDVDKEISEMKLSLNARARIVAESYLSTVSPQWPTTLHKLVLLAVRLIFTGDRIVSLSLATVRIDSVAWHTSSIDENTCALAVGMSRVYVLGAQLLYIQNEKWLTGIPQSVHVG
jgi:hypothetical protein